MKGCLVWCIVLYYIVCVCESLKKRVTKGSKVPYEIYGSLIFTRWRVHVYALHWKCTRIEVPREPLLWFEAQQACKPRKNALYKWACKSLAYRFSLSWVGLGIWVDIVMSKGWWICAYVLKRSWVGVDEVWHTSWNGLGFELMKFGIRVEMSWARADEV